MRAARLQMSDLGRADNFFGSLLSKEDIKERENKPPAPDPPKAPQVNGNSPPFRTDVNPRFSDPPAPPPQQPLPEKPDVARSHPFDPASPSLKRTNTERPRSVPNTSPVRQEPTSQIVNLVEQLASAKKEIDTQSARLRDLEEMLQKERRAREQAEEMAKRLELEPEVMMNGHVKSGAEGSVLEEAFEPPSDPIDPKNEEQPEPAAATEKTVDPIVISDSTAILEKRLETMLVDMQELRDHMESFKKRAETAEAERDTDRKTLAEMVEKIRADEARRSSSIERARSMVGHHKTDSLPNATSDHSPATQSPILEKAGLANGSVVGSAEDSATGRPAMGILSKRAGGHDPLLYHTTPYASMLGVVLIGMGLMAYLNGWQPPKADR
jgi:hypothetical protein